MEGTTRTICFKYQIGDLVYLRQQAEAPEKTICWVVEGHEAAWTDVGAARAYRLCTTNDQYGKKDASRIAVPEFQLRPWPPEEKTAGPQVTVANENF